MLSPSLTLGIVIPGMRVDVLHDTIRGNPRATLPGLNVQDVHGVDFLEGATLGFVDEEVDNENTDEAAASKDVSVGVVDGVGDEGGEEGDEEVPGPV